MQNNINCVLLIDDDEATNFIHQMAIEDSGNVEHIIIKQSGFDALSFLKSAPDGIYPQPDLIFLDINMPAMDGWDFLEEYNKLTEEQKGNKVIIMLTTSENPDDRKKAEQFGIVDNFMYKPLTKNQFQEVTTKYFNNSEMTIS